MAHDVDGASGYGKGEPDFEDGRPRYGFDCKNDGCDNHVGKPGQECAECRRGD
jgi:hypothetical protein